MFMINYRRPRFRKLTSIAKSVRVSTQNPAYLRCFPAELICEICDYHRKDFLFDDNLFSLLEWQKGYPSLCQGAAASLCTTFTTTL